VSAGIAELTHNEAAFVCSGGAAGLVLSTLACMIWGLTSTRWSASQVRAQGALTRNEVIVHASHRNPYDPAIRLAGARIYQIGNVWQTFDSELRAAINGRTGSGVLLRPEIQRERHGALP